MSQSVSVVVHYQRYYISTHVRCQGYVRRLGQSNDQYFSTTRHRFQAVLGRVGTGVQMNPPISFTPVLIPPPKI